jgi:hypothetical protein
LSSGSSFFSSSWPSSFSSSSYTSVSLLAESSYISSLDRNFLLGGTVRAHRYVSIQLCTKNAVRTAVTVACVAVCSDQVTDCLAGFFTTLHVRILELQWLFLDCVDRGHFHDCSETGCSKNKNANKTSLLIYGSFGEK